MELRTHILLSEEARADDAAFSPLKADCRGLGELEVRATQ